MSILVSVIAATWLVSTTAVGGTYIGCLISKRVRSAVFG